MGAVSLESALSRLEQAMSIGQPNFRFAFSFCSNVYFFYLPSFISFFLSFFFFFGGGGITRAVGFYVSKWVGLDNKNASIYPKINKQLETANPN